MTKATKILRLTASNVKRLRAVEITPDGAVVVVAGRNGAGKSSVLDAIWMALGGRKAIPRRPVREGAEEATIRLDLDGGMVVERTIQPDGSSRLHVSSPDGARYPSPQTLLDALVGSLSFDPLVFARMKPAEQRELLRGLVGLDTSAIDGRRETLYRERTDKNREVKRLEGELTGVPRHEDAPAAEVSVAELTAELRAAEEHQRAITRAEAHVDKCNTEALAAHDTADALRTQISGFEVQIADFQAQIEQLRGRLARGEDEVIPARLAALVGARGELGELLGSAPDSEAIVKRLAGAEQLNARVRDNRRRDALAEQLRLERTASETLTASIEECDRQRAELIAGAAYPLPGLAVDEHGVTLSGLPLEQASSAEQLRVSVAIGLALHPQLRVLLVRDGSLLDADSLRLLGDLATEADAQVWLERVGDEGAVGIVIEDGAVRAPGAA